MTYFIVIALVVLSGFFSGLNLGLMALNTQELKRKARLGDKNAKKIYPLRKKGNFLLVTLLLGNVAVNAVLAIFLGSIASGVIAGIASTALIVVFGEIIPQATFSRYALVAGAKLVWLVKLFMFLMYPAAKPMAFALDRLLGAELGTIYSKRELIEIIEEHKKSRQSDVVAEEEKIIRGALTFADIKVKDVMTPKSVVVSFDGEHKVDDEFLKTVINSGLSRFPVYKQKPDNIIGILHVHDLLKRGNMGKPAGKLITRKVLFVDEATDLVHAFNKILKSRHPLAIVTDKFKTVLGVVTLEDIIEEIIQDEIVDEYDRYADMRKVANKK